MKETNLLIEFILLFTTRTKNFSEIIFENLLLTLMMKIQN